ncbi:hypothetical protein B0H14DRAFT_3430690 [Mycena olivaceomarginata]|nr:hypothetical protein B0H14DRAFT_3430690 [Mycena olivaceomarginata]
MRGGYPPQIEYHGSQIEFHLNLSPDVERTAQEYTARPPILRHNTQPPFLFPPRASDSGSAFREEVWPPPRQESVFVDPLLRAPADDLTRIVTDIMGQPEAPTHSPPSSTVCVRGRIWWGFLRSSRYALASQLMLDDLRANGSPLVRIHTNAPAFVSVRRLARYRLGRRPAMATNTWHSESGRQHAARVILATTRSKPRPRAATHLSCVPRQATDHHA